MMTRLNGFNLGGSSHLRPPASVPAPTSGSGLRPAGSSAAAQGKQQERAIQGRGGARVSPLAPAPGTSATGPQRTAASAATGGRSAAGSALEGPSQARWAISASLEGNGSTLEQVTDLRLA